MQALGDKRLRIAFAGAGAISGFHLRGWREAGNCEVIAICDPLIEKAQARAQEFGIAKVYTDFETMLRDTKPDAVDIATPVGTHAPLTRIAANLGVHVSCQKPLTPTVAEAEALIAEVGERVRFMVHEHYRFRPHYLDMRRWLDAGKIGDILHARMTTRTSGTISVAGEEPFLLARQPYLYQFKRFVIFEAFIHQLDVMRTLLGPLQVTACAIAQVNKKLAGEDLALITMQGRAGLTAVLDGNTSAPGYARLPQDRFEIIGSKDTMIYDADKLYLVSGQETPLTYDLAADYQRCWSGCIADFVHGLRTGAAFQTDRLDNIETLKLMEQAYVVAGVSF
jgi:D-apiose dehydrogenase